MVSNNNTHNYHRMNKCFMAAAAIALTYTNSYTHAFSIIQNQHHTTITSTTTTTTKTTNLQMAPGGWGIGTPIDFQDEEFSSSSSSKRRRRRRRKDSTESSSSDSSSSTEEANEVAYNAETTEKIASIFSMQDSQQFSQRVQQERNNLQLQKQKDLMEIAKIAGLGDRLKPKVNSENEMGGGDDFASSGKFDLDDDDDLDVRVQWED